MPRRALRLWALVLCLGCFVSVLVAQEVLAPPKADKKPVADEYHGTRVLDEYRWLEAGTDPAVKKWVEAQNAYARAHLDRLPARSPVLRRLSKLHDLKGSHYSDVAYVDGTLFALSGGALIMSDDPDDPNAEVLLVDPEEVVKKETAQIDFFSVSPDGSKVAVSVSADGNDDGTAYVFDTTTGKRLPDRVPHVYSPLGGSLIWNGDGTGFYYTRNPFPPKADKELTHQQIFFHELGRPVARDKYVYGKDFSPISGSTVDASPDGKFVLVSVSVGWTSDCFAHYLLGPSGKWETLADFSDRVLLAMFGPDDDLYLHSNKDAPRGRVLRLKLSDPNLKKAQVVIPQGEGVLQGFAPTTSLLYVADWLDGGARVRVFDKKGNYKKTVPVLPTSNVEEMLELEDDELLFHNESYLEPPAWYRYDPATGKVQKTRAMKAEYGRAKFADAEVVRAVVRSKDGTKVPMTVVRPKALKRDGNNPVLLTGYGGYGEILRPNFDPGRRIWTEQGGVYAFAHVRGDGDLGEDWHRGGLLTKKQNSFDDFAACAKWLIEQGHTSPKRLAIEGASNGGTLVAVAVTQNPELYGAAVAHVGNYDMLRQELQPSGGHDVPEFGTVKNKEQFAALYGYSPYHRVKDGTAYPAVLIVSGENDGRVDPADARKWAARMQAAANGKRPVLLWTRLGSGHGHGTFQERLETEADVFAFLFRHLRVEYKPVK